MLFLFCFFVVAHLPSLRVWFFFFYISIVENGRFDSAHYVRITYVFWTCKKAMTWHNFCNFDGYARDHFALHITNRIDHRPPQNIQNGFAWFMCLVIYLFCFFFFCFTFPLVCSFSNKKMCMHFPFQSAYHCATILVTVATASVRQHVAVAVQKHSSNVVSFIFYCHNYTEKNKTKKNYYSQFGLFIHFLCFQFFIFCFILFTFIRYYLQHLLVFIALLLLH